MLANLFKLLRRGDSNLDRLKSENLVKIQLWTLQGCLQVPEAMKSEKLKSLSYYYPNRLANILDLELLKL